MEKQTPKISVLMPAYNAEKYIGEAIESILNQTFKDFEFIIVNDCSTDKTWEIIQEYAKKDQRIKVYTTPKNLYISGALNFGIKRSASNIIARMDSDDIAMPRRLELQYDLIKSDKNLAVVGSFIKIIDEKGKVFGKRKYPLHDKQLKRKMFRYSPFAHPAVMYRKKAIMRFGGYRNVYSPSEDLNLWFRVGTKYKFATSPNFLLKYRFFLDSSSNRKLHQVEVKTLKMRWHAWRYQGYKPNLLDFIYNIGQALTIYLMPAKFRIRFFNFIRNNFY